MDNNTHNTHDQEPELPTNLIGPFLIGITPGQLLLLNKEFSILMILQPGFHERLIKAIEEKTLKSGFDKYLDYEEKMHAYGVILPDMSNEEITMYIVSHITDNLPESFTPLEDLTWELFPQNVEYLYKKLIDVREALAFTASLLVSSTTPPSTATEEA